MTVEEPVAQLRAVPVAEPTDDDLVLLRRYEPVLRFTQGELFLPMTVESYLAACELWRAGTGRSPTAGRGARLLVERGELTPDGLAAAAATAGDGALSLRLVGRPLGRAEYLAWRRDPQRPRFDPGRSRFAAVGLLGRLIDAVLRLSLLVRGGVPGGTAAAAERAYRASAEPGTCAYYGHVTRRRGYLALQYWFLYAMNDWRSTFGGVNDHEADWEQVTVFLPDPPDGDGRPAWVAFSSHDEVGADLRRRSDDPDLTWTGTHPVVFAGAGSHSGAYLPGDYLVTVQPPALRRVGAVLRRTGRLLLPWTRDTTRTAFGIPFIDHHRGDGTAVGPGGEREWRAVLVDDATPWVGGYRGLWGLDTGDPFGGERAPAGPRYERTGRVRSAWSDPVAWAALDEVPPTRVAAQRAVVGRLVELRSRIAEVDGQLLAREEELRRVRAGLLARTGAGPAADRTAPAAAQAAFRRSLEEREALQEELEALERVPPAGLPAEHPHAHLAHRALPDVDPVRSRQWVLRWWSAVSASFLLGGLAVVLLAESWDLLPALAGLTVLTLCLEAFARGRLVQFAVGLWIAGVVASLALAAAWAAVGHWREVVAGLLVLAAVVLLLANVRDFFR